MAIADTTPAEVVRPRGRRPDREPDIEVFCEGMDPD